LKSMSLRLSSQSWTSGSSSKSYRRRILPLTPGQATGSAAGRSPIATGSCLAVERPTRAESLSWPRHLPHAVGSAWRVPPSRAAGHRRPREHLAHPETCRRVDSRSAARIGACGHSTISLANQISGSQTGSQRRQAHCHARPRPAILAAAERHVRPHLAPSSDTLKVPPKQ
jgi:hypothetical protein